MRNLATIQLVNKLEPIEGADKIEKATVLGWELVVKKGEFQVGDKCIYIEVDSIVPERPEFEFLRPRKFRVRTIKLRGQVSQGLALPDTTGLPVGTDVTDKLGIRKHDPQGDKERAEFERQAALQKNKVKRFFMRNSLFRKIYFFFFRSNRLSWPGFIPKTDEERIQKFPQVLDNGWLYDVTEKLDGQSGTFFCVRKGLRKVFGVCSRNFQLGVPDNSSYWRVARKYRLKEKLAPGECIQGEIIGPKIQGNRYRRGDVELYVFNYRVNGKLMPTSRMVDWCKLHNIPHVPVLAYNTAIPCNVPELVEYSRGTSVIADGVLREGIVCRNYEHNQSFKVNRRVRSLWKYGLLQAVEILDTPCRLCGGLVTCDFVEETRQRLKRTSTCFGCDFFPQFFDTEDPRIFVIDGHVYQKGDEDTRGMQRGFAGSRFVLKKFGMPIEETSNLWCRGEVPYALRHRIPDNAMFVNGKV